jgi:septum formation protein
MKLILASASPRRADLLRQIAVVPDAIEAPAIDEAARPRELPASLVRRLALAKALAVQARHPDAMILAGDTVVACGRRILPQASNEDEARACLALLSGRRHRVHGAIALCMPGRKPSLRHVITRVRFKRLSESEIADYLASGEWRGKAGGYAIQGRAGAFVPWIEGSYSNVVGFDLASAASLLAGAWGARA